MSVRPEPGSADGQSRPDGTTGFSDAPQQRAIAESRGKDWALPDASRGATAITRPIVLQVSADRVVVMSHVGANSGKTIMMPGATQASVDELVSSVWDYMKNWGIAGRGLYWKPIISAQVVPGGELRATELRALLEGSGMDINFRR